MNYQIHAKVTLKGVVPFEMDMSAPHGDWANIAEPHRNGSVINIPDTQFHYAYAVDDERVGSWASGCLVPFPEPTERNVANVIPGGVVVLLESPHACEYDHFFRPVGPLQNPTSRARFLCQINRLLEGEGIAEGTDILLANPIQFQTSLFRLLTPCAQVGGMPGFRDAVWKKLWDNLSIRAGFCSRLNSYQPSLVINACTGGSDRYKMKALLQPWLKERWSRVKVATEHVSVWSENTSLSDEIPGDEM